MGRIRRPRHGSRRGARGIGAFIITPDLPGFHVGKKEDKLGLRGSPTVQLNFDNMRVPATNLLGDEAQGFVACRFTAGDNEEDSNGPHR